MERAIKKEKTAPQEGVSINWDLKAKPTKDDIEMIFLVGSMIVIMACFNFAKPYVIGILLGIVLTGFADIGATSYFNWKPKRGMRWNWENLKRILKGR